VPGPARRIPSAVARSSTGCVNVLGDFHEGAQLDDAGASQPDDAGPRRSSRRDPSTRHPTRDQHGRPRRRRHRDRRLHAEHHAVRDGHVETCGANGEWELRRRVHAREHAVMPRLPQHRDRDMPNRFADSAITNAPKTRYVSAPSSVALRRPTHFGLTTRLASLYVWCTCTRVEAICAA
jgi:hypothetical protein